MDKRTTNQHNFNSILGRSAWNGCCFSNASLLPYLERVGYPRLAACPQCILESATVQREVFPARSTRSLRPSCPNPALASLCDWRNCEAKNANPILESWVKTCDLRPGGLSCFEIPSPVIWVYTLCLWTLPPFGYCFVYWSKCTMSICLPV